MKRIVNTFTKSILTLSLVGFSSFGFSNHTCSGRVLTVDVHGPGDVQASVEGVGQGMIFCSLTSKVGLYEAESCKALLSVLLAAKATGDPVKLWFNNDADTSCSKGAFLSNQGFYYLQLLE